jgi:hypothetical protein
VLRKVLLILLVVAAVLAAVVALQPSDYRVMRTLAMDAPAAVVFAQINDFHKWAAWNPWGQIDPGMQQGYEGAPAGVGAAYTWRGNAQVGEGRMTIVESRPPELVRVQLDFAKPFAGTSVAEFVLRPEGSRTVVTWSMAGTKNFVAKAIHLVMSMDRMIGGQFEKGLAQMKAVAEKAARS